MCVCVCLFGSKEAQKSVIRIECLFHSCCYSISFKWNFTFSIHICVACRHTFFEPTVNLLPFYAFRWMKNIFLSVFSGNKASVIERKNDRIGQSFFPLPRFLPWTLNTSQRDYKLTSTLRFFYSSLFIRLYTRRGLQKGWTFLINGINYWHISIVTQLKSFLFSPSVFCWS